MTRLVLLLAAAGAACAQTWQGVDRIVAVGDVHGSFTQFTTVLRQAGVIDDKNTWTGGKTHLVQLGDVPDRAPDTRRIMDLLMELEKQASKAGGKVHALIGNHEAMNIYGDLRYTVPEEFASFRTGTSEEVRSKFWEQHVEEMRRKGAPSADAEYRQRWFAQYPAGFFEHRFEFNPDGKYGKWIREHDAVIKINDTLFLHGGLSPKFAASSLSDLNKRVRKELFDLKKIVGGIVTDPEGPLWYRGLATAPETELAAHVDDLLRTHGASRIIIGHTPTGTLPIARFGGKVILADVGLGVAYGGPLACVIIENGQMAVMNAGVKQAFDVNGQPSSTAEAGQ